MENENVEPKRLQQKIEKIGKHLLNGNNENTEELRNVYLTATTKIQKN